MRRLAGWAGVALLVATLAAGCGNRGGSLVNVIPEGNPNQGVLLAQVDTVDHVLSATALVYLQVPANRARLYDSVDNRGFVPFDAISEPLRTYSTNWSAFRVPILNYDPSSTHLLIARGSRDGLENALSPRTNPVFIPNGGILSLVPPRDTIPLAPRATQLHFDAPPLVHVDSLFLHIGTVAEAQRVVIEITKGPVTNYLAIYDRQAGNSFTRSYVFEDLAPELGQTYSWSVDEYNDVGRLLASTTRAQGTGGFIIDAPMVAGAPFAWPTDASHVLFDPWTIPPVLALARPPGR